MRRIVGCAVGCVVSRVGLGDGLGSGLCELGWMGGWGEETEEMGRGTKGEGDRETRVTWAMWIGIGMEHVLGAICRDGIRGFGWW